MTQAVEHSAHLAALTANGFDFDRRSFQAKTQRARLFSQCSIQRLIVDLGHAAADAAHQELAAVLIFGAIATQEGIQRIQTMHEPGFLQELQGSVDGRRGGFLTILGQLGQDLIGANRLVLAPNDLEHAPSQGREVYLTRRAHLFGRRDRALNASGVVVRNSLSVYCFRHTALDLNRLFRIARRVVVALQHGAIL